MVMLSRVANHIYWMARYLERAENTARLVSVNGSLVLDLPPAARPDWRSLIAITGSGETFQRSHPEAGESLVVRFMVADAGNPGSILSSLQRARENARTIRDIIPREAWEQINSLYLSTRDALPGGLAPMRRNALLASVILGVQQIAGILDGGMSHDAGYEFLRLGLNLERADMTSRIIDVRCQDLPPERTEMLKPFENILWMSVLKSLTAYQMYRRNVQATVKRDLVARFLLVDSEFPRSLLFCLQSAQQCLKKLPDCSASLNTLRPLLKSVLAIEPETLGPQQLHEFIDTVQIGLGRTHDALNQCYFGERMPAQMDVAA